LEALPPDRASDILIGEEPRSFASSSSMMSARLAALVGMYRPNMSRATSTLYWTSCHLVAIGTVVAWSTTCGCKSQLRPRARPASRWLTS